MDQAEEVQFETDTHMESQVKTPELPRNKKKLMYQDASATKTQSTNLLGEFTILHSSKMC